MIHLSCKLKAYRKGKNMAYANTIETSTAMLDYFVYHGTYETLIGEYLGCVAPNERKDAETDIANAALDIIAGALWYVFPHEVRDDFEFTYVNTYHPRYYNFETDAINFDFSYSNALKDWMFEYAEENKEQFDKFLHENFTSRDGFISFTSNNWNDWFEGWNESHWRSVSVLLWFIIEQEIQQHEIESYEYDFDESARDIIEEKYTCWEYAEKFDNGFIGVVYGGWDEEEDATVYDCYLLDENGKVVNYVKIADEYDEDFHMSAYAVWEYSWVQSDLTKKFTLCGIHSEPCEVPDIETVKIA